ncbi:brca1 interacting protein C-terminal helicase 1 brip1 [Tritrichomonas foetus]|uniref:Brca1 interacting protein C-terminal helicase 1 brip1 n=1 Tax=Tritrichomonas foetus TaxID=1144522 RepID=A0A1J4KMK0_9EUKA|nr:brca1 interacting protein C-terminal helicase 1 brip1 [Tritrichomonas foetus]|eukprot:OHT12535.1 brca1 interacting protein C-terminal helicase 1 brip1 [Tritrichomonas foetus]
MNSFFSNSMNNADNDWENPMNHHVPSSYGNHNYDLPQGRMNQIKVLGVPVDFPYQNIYPSQRALIANSIKAFQNQENALLQAPTGTGKALALLAASLAYQQHVIDQKIIINHPRNNSLSQVRANDTFAIFSGSGSFQDPASEPSHFNIQPPRIWFTSRTHTQLKQLISEYKRLPYNPTMVVLGGRKQLCLNKKVLKSNDRDGECRKLLEENKCPFRMKAGIPPEFRRGGKYEKFEIEDMLEYGKKNMRCAYHMSLVILSKADLVFCPYNYVLDPKIKGQLELSLVGSFLIIDEAHNVENICREAGTFKITSDDLNFTLMIFRKLKENFIKEDPDFVSLILLLDFVQTISKWFTSQINGMKFLKQKERIENPITVINEWGLNQETWPQYEFVMTTIIKRKVVVVEEVNQKPHFEIPLRSLSLLENLFIFFVFIFQNNMENANNFQIPIVVGNKDDGSEDFMQIVCLTPSVVFKCISRETHSLILASGTLSPLSTFASELGTKFPIQISANHIIGPDQLQSYIVTHALDGTPFNSSYQTMSANKDNTVKLPYFHLVCQISFKFL